MTVENIKELSFEDKVRLLPEKEQSYLQGYVDRAIASFKPKQTKQPHKSPVDHTI